MNEIPLHDHTIIYYQYFRIFVKQNNNTPFAPLLSDDKKHVKILLSSTNLDNYLLFTKRSLDEFTESLAYSMDFDSDNQVKLKWAKKGDNKIIDFEGLGYKFESWGMTNYSALIKNLTFGSAIEEIIKSYTENVRKSSSGWNIDPRKYHVKEFIGYMIYHNLLNIYSSKIKKSNNIFKELEKRVIHEIRNQQGDSIDFMDERYVKENSVKVKPCDDSIILAGLCLVWPQNFFNVNKIGKIDKNHLRNPDFKKKCSVNKCIEVNQKTIWTSKARTQSENGLDFRAKITQDFCLCGKSKVSAFRLVKFTDNTHEEVLVTDTNNPDFKIRDFKEIKDEKGRKRTERKGPHVIGPKKKFNLEKFTKDKGYFKTIIEFLLVDIFTKQIPRNGKIPIRGKELPLPRGDIALLCSQIATSIAFPMGGKGASKLNHLKQEIAFLKGKLNQYRKLISNEDYENNKIHFEQMVRETKNNLDKLNTQINEIFPGKDTQLDLERAAKHRLGVKLTEIGRFLEWWGDLEPIFNELYSDKYGKSKEPLKAIKRGIANLSGDNYD